MAVIHMLVQHLDTAGGELAMFAGERESASMNSLVMLFHHRNSLGKIPTKIAGEAPTCNTAVCNVFKPSVALQIFGVAAGILAEVTRNGGRIFGVDSKVFHQSVSAVSLKATKVTFEATGPSVHMLAARVATRHVPGKLISRGQDLGALATREVGSVRGSGQQLGNHDWQ